MVKPSVQMFQLGCGAQPACGARKFVKIARGNPTQIPFDVGPPEFNRIHIRTVRWKVENESS